MMSFSARAATVLSLFTTALTAAAQPYPEKPLRFLVGFTAGGSTDIAARLIAQQLAERIGQPVLVENRPGGDTIIAADAVAKSPPDGHTLLFMTFSTVTILPHTRARLPYDPFRDFVHIAQIAYVPYALALHPAVPVKSVADLIALARAKPGALAYASGSEGAHITAEMFKTAAGVDIIHVPYKGSGPATNDVLGGQVPMMFSLFAGNVPHFKSGRLRPLVVTSERRSPALPDVPTMAESGFPGFESSSSFGLGAPRGTPEAAVARLNRELAAILQHPEVAEKFLAQGIEPRHTDSARYTAILHAESAKYRAVLERIGYRKQ